MLKKYKWNALFSLLVTLLPIVFVCVKWNDIGKFHGMCTTMLVATAVMVVLDIVCIGSMLWSSRRNQQSGKIITLSFWIMPMISVVVNVIFWLTVFGKTARLTMILPMLLGFLMLVMGNYMPKCKQNRMMGFKFSWTLANEENWNKTHRFGGYVMMVGGVIIMLTALLPDMAMLIALLAVTMATMISVTVYSALLYKKQVAAGTAEPLKPSKKAPGIVTAIISVVVLCGAAVLMFTGDVTATCGDTALSIQATYWEDTELPYTEIDSAEYRENGVPGTRVGGFGSPRQLLGNFANDELGAYTRFTYGDSNAPCIVLKQDDLTIVLGLKTAEETKALYDALLEKLPK